VVGQIAALIDEPGDELQVHGSPTLVRFLLAEGLLQELRLITFPVLVGAGRRLFPDSGPAIALDLTSSDTTTTGATIQVYEPAGPARYGSFALDA
jgi:dihydrofolate reductase